jgi:hypothetical protein
MEKVNGAYRLLGERVRDTSLEPLGWRMHQPERLDGGALSRSFGKASTLACWRIASGGEGRSDEGWAILRFTVAGDLPRLAIEGSRA